ncbi:glycosyltransferase [Streptomyces sp. ODS28]|uniref:glycosyltransferase n=1 Tax=Streptomyces sp. ODS28 TaxID=3136688 RepID=UPI0031EC43B8
MSTGRDLFLVANSIEELGGVTAWTHQMARVFTEHGHRVHAIGVKQADIRHGLDLTASYPMTSLYRAHPPRPWRPRGLLRRCNAAAALRERARAAAERERVELLSSLFSGARPGGMVIVSQVWAMEWISKADTAGMPVIGMSHESYDYTRQSGRYARVKKFYPAVDRWLALTQEDADRWTVQEGMNNVGFMPNALAGLPPSPSPRTEKVVASVGRLSDQKGIDLLLETWALVAPHRPEWRLHLHGAGEDEEELRRQCTALGLDGSVEWKGRTDDVPGVLRESSVFVQSSRGEGFPLALMEAMASAVPCAAFDCAPGVRTIVRDGEDGLLAPPGDTAALADRLLRLTGDAGMRDAMGDRARQNVQRFSEAEVLREWERLFALLEL